MGWGVSKVEKWGCEGRGTKQDWRGDKGPGVMRTRWVLSTMMLFQPSQAPHALRTSKPILCRFKLSVWQHVP